jgi:predicted ATPase/signal transduction histidine kinase
VPEDLAALRREAMLAVSLEALAPLQPRWVDVGAEPAGLVYGDPGAALLSACIDAPLPVDAVLAIGLQVGASLAELHRRDIVHRGVRPDAILYHAPTARAWLIDLGDAVRKSERMPHGTRGVPRLSYAAPEQTGRIDRPVDQRSDLYALGLVLHRLLTGAPVLRSDDPLEWIHWHLAGTAPVPSEIDRRIPAALSALVLKLIAKSPDERYQSAAALLADLDHCTNQWRLHGRIAAFDLGRFEARERLVISNRLYGREREVQALLDALTQACNGTGRASLLLVEGYAGVGKTALIEQLYRPIVRREGTFIGGKFDQVVRSVPFGALIQAFRGLVRQLLTESEARLARWRDALREALGANGGVLVEVIPEIAFIVGPQPAPAQLGPTEAQNRFQRVLVAFVGALAKPEHPLVLFLDDLQWADAATLGLFEPLLASDEIRGLLLIGACRDQDTDSGPQLSRLWPALESAGVRVQRIRLGPLALADLTRLVADTLACAPDAAEPLARLVHAKTGGNPFFVTQFLVALARDGQIRFDAAAGRWTYEIERIAEAPLAENVVALMARSIGRLPARSQYVLTLAACIGNRFDAPTLAVVSEQSEAATASDLAAAVGEGLVLPVAADAAGVATYAFLHDRVQQAAYALIPDERRRMLHLTIGRLLRGRGPQADVDARRLFDIVHHLDLGLPLIRSRDERLDVAALNLEAGRRAKSSTAHAAALQLFEAGRRLVEPEARAGAAATLAFEIGLELAESRYLCGQFDAAEGLMAQLIDEADGSIDRARVVRLRSVQLENRSRYADALAESRAGLALFDLVLPDGEAAQAAAIEREIAAIEQLAAGRPIGTLVDLPTMADARTRMVMAMLTDVWSAAYILGEPTLARLISATLVRLSLEHGNVEESAYGYVTHAITVGPMRGDFAAGCEWGELALRVNERFADLRRRAKIQQQFHAHVAPWSRPYETCIAYAREACRNGLESGDFLYAAYAAGTEAWPAMAATQDLDRFVRDYEPSVALIEKLKNPGFADSLRALLGWARALQGRTAAPLSMSDASFDEAAHVRRYADNPFFTTIHAVARLQLCCLLGSVDEALQAAHHSALTAHRLQGTIWPLEHDFWHGIARARAADDVPSTTAALAALRDAEATYARLARHCPVNFMGQTLLLRAEIACLEGRAQDAMSHAEQAIEFAAAAPRIRYEALAHETCARLHGVAGRSRVAALHWAAARDRYRRWGAYAKAAALEREQELDGGADVDRGQMALRPAEPGAAGIERASTGAAPGTGPGSAVGDGLDLVSVMKAGQAIAAEVELDALVPRLLQIAIENAGAERGALVLETEGGAIVSAASLGAAIGGGSSSAADAVALEQSTAVPVPVVNYVRRTAATLVLSEPEIDDRHGDDAYVAVRRPRSLACLPVQRQGRLIGVLYVDHARVAGAFNEARLAVLQTLAAQAAIAVENARLVAGLKREIDERTRAQAQLGAALAEVERLKDDLEAENSYLRRDLIANVSHDLRTPLVSMRGYLEVLVAKGDRLDAEQRARHLAVAVRQSEHLARLVDELFELAKLDFKGITLDRETFALGDLANDVLQKFQLAADGHRINLSAEVRPGLPCVHADLGLIERVLENLIGNALRHTPAGGRVTVRLQAGAGGVEVEVADTGGGIAAADLPHVFDRYYRSAEARRAGASGAGLGLAITRRILELHGSRIAVDSTVGVGTRFVFCLPAA